MRKLGLTFLLTGALILTLGKACFNVLGDKGFPEDIPTGSPLLANLKGVFVRSVHANPESLVFENHTITFADAWIERKVKTHYFLAWFPIYERRPGYFICFHLQGDDVLKPRALEGYNPLFIRPGRGASFTSWRGRSQSLFFDDLDQAAFEHGYLRGSLVHSFTDPHPDNFFFLW